MKCITAFILILFISISAICQEKWDVKMYNKYDHENFREEKVFHQVLNFEDLDIPLINAAIFYVTNEIRAKKKLSILTYNKLLEQSASMHSEDMYKYNFFNHDNPKDKKKKTPNDRAKLAGIENPYLAENIAEAFGIQYKANSNVYILGKGKFSYKPDGALIERHTYLSVAETLLDMWMNSEGHRKNIVSPDALQLGCGVYFYIDEKFNNIPKFKATQNFQWYENVRIK